MAHTYCLSVEKHFKNSNLRSVKLKKKVVIKTGNLSSHILYFGYLRPFYLSDKLSNHFEKILRKFTMPFTEELHHFFRLIWEELAYL